MSNLVTPIQVPVTNGVVRSIAQVRLEMAGLPLPGGFASVMRKRTRSRETVYGNNADPVGKTTGNNAYECTVEMYYDWYVALLQTIQNNFGNGYGDQFFDVYLTYVGANLNTYFDVITSCTFDNDEINAQKGTSPLISNVQLNPLKIYFGIPDGANYTDAIYDDNPDPLDTQTG